jgi:hypothetical protein
MAEVDEQKQTKQCFVIAPIGKDESETRRRSDMLLDHVFIPALVPIGYEVVRADKISEPGSITIQVLNRILEADLVIADLTDHNPNVFYELAVRHALNKGVIHVICSGQTIPFDIADLRTIHVVLDIPGAAKAITEITAQAKQLESGEVGKTPISLANILSRSDAEKSDEGILMREMLDRMTELGASMRDLNEFQRHSQKLIERKVDTVARSMRRNLETDSTRESEMRIKVRAKDLNSTLDGLPAPVRERFLKLSPIQKDIVAEVFESELVVNPDRRFIDSLEKSIAVAELFGPK